MNPDDKTADADFDCMKRLKAGDDLALNEIMDRWQQRVANYLMRQLGNEADAVDLAQETFVRVYESRHRYEPSAAFATWLFRIATNLALSRFRWRSRHPAVSLEAGLSDDIHTSSQPEPVSPELPASGQIMRRETVRLVKTGIGRLDADARSILLLFEFEELSHKEIGVILGMSAKAVESRLYRARQALRVELEKIKHDIQ